MAILPLIQYFVFLGFWVSLYTLPIWTSVIISILMHSKYFYIALIYASWLIVDRQTPSRGGRLYLWYRKLPLWSCVTKYFPVVIHKTSDLDPNKNYIFGCHPHGNFAYGTAGQFFLNAEQFENLFPGIIVRPIMHSAAFWFPFYRDLSLFFGICSSDKESIEYIFTKPGNGNAVAIAPGGAKEFFDVNPHKMKLTLKNRKGFVKLALKHGASLVPCICFDDIELFADLDCQYKYLFKYLRRWSRNGVILQMICAVLFNSLWPICNWKKMIKIFSPFDSNRKQLHLIIGNPIEVLKTESPREEEIDRFHQIYIQSVCDLFYSNRQRYANNKQMKLIIN